MLNSLLSAAVSQESANYWPFTLLIILGFISFAFIRRGTKNKQAKNIVNGETSNAEISHTQVMTDPHIRKLVNKQLAKETRLVVLLVGVVGAGVTLFIPGFSLIGLILMVIAILIVKIYQRPIRQRIEVQMKKEALGQVSSAPSSNKSGDPAERLKKLAILRDDGLITAEDYELKKTHLLEEL